MTADNPKEAAGRAKTPMSVVPANVLMRLGAVLAHGAAKYGRHNWRVAGINLSTYYDAAHRHLAAWWEGEDNDPESGESHLAHAMATLAVALDAIEQGKANDDRPPASKTAPVRKPLEQLAGEFAKEMAKELYLRGFPDLVTGGYAPTPTEQS